MWRNEHKRATKNGRVNINIAEHHLKTSHTNDWDSPTCVTYSTDHYQRIILESWFINLEQTALNRFNLLPHLPNDYWTGNSNTLLHSSCNSSPHKSSQPITSRVYQRLLYLLTNQTAHQGFWIFNWLRLSLDSEDGFHTDCRDLSHQQQSFSGLQSTRRSFSIKVCYCRVQTIFLCFLMWQSYVTFSMDFHQKDLQWLCTVPRNLGISK